MSSILGRGTTTPYTSKEEMKAAAQLAKSEAFAEAQKTLGEDTPQAPNTDSSGNSKVSHQSTGTSTESASSTPPAQPPQSNQSPSTSSQNVASQPASNASEPSRSSLPSSTNAPSRDTLEASRPASSSPSSGNASNQSGSSNDHLTALDATMVHDMANIASTSQVTVVRVESLGNPDAMTRELLNALRDAATVQPTGLDPAAQAALASMAQKTVDNIPHMLVDTDTARGTKLFLPDPHSSKTAATPDSRYLASESARVQALQELAHGPEWPHMLLEGLQKAGENWHAQFPNNDPLANAMMSLYGKEVSVLGKDAGQDALSRLASLANAPLSLPAAGLMRTDDNVLASFSVHSTHLAGEGQQMMITLMDVPASIEAGREVYKTMEAEQFAKVVYVLVVPDGKPAVAVQREHEAELNTLGLIGCCLTSGGGGNMRSHNSLRTAATRGGGGGGLLENRCVTCARAQQLCQPTSL